MCVSGEGVSGEDIHTLVPAVANWMVGVCSDGWCNLIGKMIFEQMDHTLFREYSRLQVA